MAIDRSTVSPGDQFATTHAAIPPQHDGALRVDPPLMLTPPDGVWELLSTASVCDAGGAIHFFWFWRQETP